MQADVFSFGVCLWEMFIRRIPYEELPPSRIIIGVATEGLTLPNINDIPSPFQDLCVACLRHKAKKRPTFDVLHDTFVNLQVGRNFSC